MKFTSPKTKKDDGDEVPDDCYKGPGGFLYSKATRKKVPNFVPGVSGGVKSNSISSFDRSRRRHASGSTNFKGCFSR